MRRIVFIVLLAAVLLGVTTSTAWAAPPGQKPAGVDTLGEAIGALGLFAAVMAVLALGTEVVMDFVKLGLGMKRKPTAMEAVSKLEDWLPGTLKDLGVSAAAEEQIKGYIKAMNSLVAGVEKGQQAIQRVEEWLPDKLEKLAILGADRFWEEHGDELREELIKYGLDGAVLDQIEGSLKTGLHGLQPTLIAEQEEYASALTNLLQAVENRRNGIQSPLRKVLRWLRKIPILGRIVSLPERFFNFARGTQPEKQGRDAAGEPVKVPPLKPSEVAQFLMEQDDQHRDEEESRARWLRALSIPVGIILAVKLGIDSAELLHPLIGDAFAGELKQKLLTIQSDPVFSDWALIGPLWVWVKDVLVELTAGIALSGLAASAGSAFWHDQLDKLQVAKKAQTQLEGLTAELRKVARGGK